MVLSLRVTPSMMTDDFDESELDELEFEIQKLKATMQRFASRMNANMNRMESLHSSRLDQVETLIAEMMRRSGLEDEHLSAPITGEMSSDSSIDIPHSSSSLFSSLSPTVPEMESNSFLCFDNNRVSVLMDSEIPFVSKQIDEIDDPVLAVSTSTPFIQEVAIDNPMITDDADEFAEVQNPPIVQQDRLLQLKFYFFPTAHYIHNWAQAISARSKPRQCASICPRESFYCYRKIILVSEERCGILAIACRGSTHHGRFSHGSQTKLVFDPGTLVHCEYLLNYCYGRSSLLCLLYFSLSIDGSVEKRSICYHFIEMLEGSLILWNLLIGGFEYHGLHEKAILIVGTVTLMLVAINHMKSLHLILPFVKFGVVEGPFQHLNFSAIFYSCVNVLWPIPVMPGGFKLQHHDCYALPYQLIFDPGISLPILKSSFQFSTPFLYTCDYLLTLSVMGTDCIKHEFDDCPNYISPPAIRRFTLKLQMPATCLFIGYSTNSCSHAGFVMLLLYIKRFDPKDAKSNGCLGLFELYHLSSTWAAISDATTMQHNTFLITLLNSVCFRINSREFYASVSSHPLFFTWISKGQHMGLYDGEVLAYNYFSKSILLALIQAWFASLFCNYLASLWFHEHDELIWWIGNNVVEDIVASGYSFLVQEKVLETYYDACVRWLLDKFCHLKVIDGYHWLAWELSRKALLLPETKRRHHSCAFAIVNKYQCLLICSFFTQFWAGLLVVHYTLCLILDDLGQTSHENKIPPPLIDVISCQYELIDFLLIDGVEFKFQAGMSFTFMMVVIVPFGNGQHLVSLTISIHFTWIYLILLCWNGLDPPACVDLGILHSSFLNLDLEDKVHFNGGSNVMNGPNISNGPVNGPKGKCEIINTDGEGFGGCGRIWLKSLLSLLTSLSPFSLDVLLPSL